MSTDTQHPFGLDDDDAVPCGTPLCVGAATAGDIDVFAFEPGRPPAAARRAGRLRPLYDARIVAAEDAAEETETPC